MKFIKSWIICAAFCVLLSSLAHAQDETVNGNLNVSGSFWQHTNNTFQIGHLESNSNLPAIFFDFWDYNTLGKVTFASARWNTEWRWGTLDSENNSSANHTQMILDHAHKLRLSPYPASYPNNYYDPAQIMLNPDRDYPNIFLGGMTIQHHEPGNGSAEVKFNTRCYVANWTWGTDGYGGSMSRKQMVLNVENSLILYNSDESNQQSIIISPRRAYLNEAFIAVDDKRVVLESQNRPVRFDTTVRIAPQGDLSMGEFVSEPQ